MLNASHFKNVAEMVDFVAEAEENSL